MPASLYVGIWAALMVLTLTTVLASFAELGPFNIVVALLIATIKGTLVVLFFMHLRYSPKLTMASGDCVDILAVHHVFTHHDGLPVARLGNLRRAVKTVVSGQLSVEWLMPGT